RRDPRQRLGDDRARAPIALVPGRELRVPYLAGDFLLQLLLDLLHEKSVGLLARHAGDPFELPELLLVGLLELRAQLVQTSLPLAQRLFSATELIGATLEVLLLLDEPPLELLSLLADGPRLLLRGGPDADRLLLG